MEEINDLHTKSLEWGCVTNLIDKIGDIEDKIEGHWDQLCDMIADIITEGSNVKDPTTIFFDIYQYCFRLYYRLRANPVRRPFNTVSKISVSGEEHYRITNYDYNTFKWAKKSGFGMTISNDYIDLLEKSLSESQRRAMSRRISKAS